MSSDPAAPLAPQRLLAVLANPPLGPGTRTTARVELARAVLELDEACIANMLQTPTKSTPDISEVAQDGAVWASSRTAITNVLGECSDVLLAYGVSAPSGPARAHFTEQVVWLRAELETRAVRVWQVGDGPRHASRWQRWTFRAHPGVDFPDALRRSLRRAD